MSYLDKAIADKHAILDETSKRPRITYIAVNRTDYFDDPEEKVRAEFWAELIYSYAYPPQRLGIEVTIPDRVPTDRADIVIFRDDERKRPYAIIECKKAEVTDAEYQQAIEQAFGNGTWAKLRADYVAVVAGLTRTVYDFSDRYGALERDGNIIADLPRAYGKAPEWRFTKGGARDITPVSPYELRSILKKCHDTLWGGGRLSPTAAFGELCKIVFVKIHDEKANRKKDEPYQFQIRTHETAASLTARIKELYAQHRQRDPEVFNEDIRVGDETLSLVVRHLEGCNLNKTDLDVKGQAFQKFMSGFFKGDAGQFYTPTPLVRFAVRMMEPKNDERVIDPACGSGGFLLEALDYVRVQADEYHDKGTNEHFQHWHDFAQRNLFGIEINDEIARVAKMNMIIHDDGHTNVICEDALEGFKVMEARSRNRAFRAGAFDLVLTNPPFGATVSKTERPYLGDYDLGNSGEGAKRKIRNNQKTEILFIERIWQFLKPGAGRAAVVLPDGILTNASSQYVRDFLLSKFQLLAVVSLPPFAFAHFGAGVKSSLIFVRKLAQGEVIGDGEPIFMASPECIGYDGTGRETRNDLDGVIEQYHAFLRNPQPFFV